MPVRHLPFINTKACTRQCPLRYSLQWLESSFSPEAKGAHISRPQLTSPACNSVTPVREGPGAVEISGGSYSCYWPHGQLQAPDSYWIATVLLSDILSYEISLNKSYHLQFSFVFQWRLFLIQSQPNPTNWHHHAHFACDWIFSKVQHSFPSVLGAQIPQHFIVDFNETTCNKAGNFRWH